MKNAAHLVERAIDRDFVALLLAQNRVGAMLPIADVLHAHAVPLHEFDRFAADPSFEDLILRHVKDLNDNGFGVEQKAAVLHETALPIVFDILRDVEQPGMTRLKAFEMLGDIAGKGKSRQQTLASAGHNGFQLVINLGTPQAPNTETFNGVTIVADTEPITDAKTIVEMATQATSTTFEATRAPVQLPLFDQDEYDAEAEAYAHE